jgi:hypothetical protein
MFGEWESVGARVEALAKALSWVCLAMCPIVLVGWLARRRSELVDELPLSLIAVLLVGGIAVQRANMPVFHGDFRYVLPVVLQLSWWYVIAAAIAVRRGWRRVGTAVAALGWVAVMLSVAFVVALVSSSA